MKARYLKSGLIVVAILLQFACSVVAQNAKVELRWVDAKELGIEGKGWTDTKNFYDRLPAKAEGVVREPVWFLSQDCAGLRMHFVTDATEISARWTLRKERLALPHMPMSGASGLDLYVRFDGGWHWLGATRPEKTLTNQGRLTTGMTPQKRECVLYLPLYNGIAELEIGVPIVAKIEPVPVSKQKPVVFYGTSIVQGASASRPGMTHSAQLSRRFEFPFINLGFAGNGVCEPEIARLLAELDPAVYVIDPLPNMRPEQVAERVPVLIAELRGAHPKTPIVLVEHIDVGDAVVVPSRRASYAKSNEALRKIFDQRVRAGDRKLFYIRGEKLLGTDGQGTVDRVHPTDLGFTRMADAMAPVLKRALHAAP